MEDDLNVMKLLGNKSAPSTSSTTNGATSGIAGEGGVSWKNVVP
jgi:hypothetical protein